MNSAPRASNNAINQLSLLCASQLYKTDQRSRPKKPDTSIANGNDIEHLCRLFADKDKKGACHAPVVMGR